MLSSIIPYAKLQLFLFGSGLSRLGLVKVTSIPSDPANFNMFNLKGASCKITNAGLDAIKNQSFHSVATSAFHDRQTIILSKRVLYLSIITVIIALISIFISLVTSKVEKRKYESLINSIESIYKEEPITIKIDSVQLNTFFKLKQKKDSIMLEQNNN